MRSKDFICKLDMEKAYNYLYWLFLLYMSQKRGFGKKMVYLDLCLHLVRNLCHGTDLKKKERRRRRGGRKEGRKESTERRIGYLSYLFLGALQNQNRAFHRLLSNKANSFSGWDNTAITCVAAVGG